ncbi:MAG: energy transducer TonB [Tannerella sp.]|nr:energy transducer TonB [Tannerella sp.]
MLETSTNEVKNAAGTKFSKTPRLVSAEDTTVYITVDKKPEFPGGEMALHKYFSDNMRYPEIARKNKKEGLVGCTFIVEKDGTLSNIQVEMSVYPALDEEALRIVKTFPKFTPGEKNGKKVRVKYAAPIGFSLSVPPPPTMEEKMEDKILTGPKTDPSDPTLYLIAEHMPEFPGGEVALFIYISKQLKYPENAAKRGIEGRVSCTFIVEKDGSVSNAKVVHPVDPDLDEEAIRVISALPKFTTPGTIDGKPVRVLCSLPIRFRLPPKPTN